MKKYKQINLSSYSLFSALRSKMNFYKVTVQVIKTCLFFLNNLGFKNIKSFSDNGSELKIQMKNGKTAEIRFNNPGVRGIYWSVEDFIIEAKDNWEKHTEDLYHDDCYKDAKSWEDVYDESLFEAALEKMIDNHNAEDGIYWTTVVLYLNENCMRQIDD